MAFPWWYNQILGKPTIFLAFPLDTTQLHPELCR